MVDARSLSLLREARYQRIYATVDSIPPGRVATYGQVAREAGLPRAARQVGYALSRLPPHSSLAWHRVVNARGELSPRGHGSDGSSVRTQARRLRAEGVVSRAGRIDLARFGWRPE